MGISGTTGCVGHCWLCLPLPSKPEGSRYRPPKKDKPCIQGKGCTGARGGGPGQLIEQRSTFSVPHTRRPSMLSRSGGDARVCLLCEDLHPDQISKSRSEGGERKVVGPFAGSLEPFRGPVFERCRAGVDATVAGVLGGCWEYAWPARGGGVENRTTMTS